MPQKPKELAPYSRYDGSGIGQRVAATRMKRGLSQADLSQKLGITRARLAHYESGRIQVSAELLGRLATELTVSADELLGLSRSREPYPEIIPTRIIKLVERSMRLPSDDARRMIFRYMKNLLDIYDPKPKPKPAETAAKEKPVEKKQEGRQSLAATKTTKKVEKRVRDDDLPKRHSGAWVPQEVEVLELYYPRCEDKAIILDLLPGRTWYDCTVKAQELGIQRKVDEEEVRKRKKPKMILPRAKLASLLRQDLTLDEIAKKMKSTPEIVRRHMWRYGL